MGYAIENSYNSLIDNLKEFNFKFIIEGSGEDYSNIKWSDGQTKIIDELINNEYFHDFENLSNFLLQNKQLKSSFLDDLFSKHY